MRYKILILLAILLSQVNVQNASAQDNKAAPDNSDADHMEVIVSASRGQEQNSLDVPQTTKIITREKLDKAPPATIDSMLRQEPNIGSAPSGGNPNYWEQGFTIRGLGGQRVLTLSDGVRQAGQGVGYGGGNLSLFDPFALEKIEILKGPESVLYGTDAFGGVINLITRKPKTRSEFGTNGGARYLYDGSANMYRFNGYFDAGDKDWGLVAGGGYLNSGKPNLPDGEPAATDGSFRNANGWAKFRYDIAKDIKLNLVGDLNRTNDVLIANSGFPLPIAVYGAPGSSQLVFSPLYFSIPKYQRSLLGGDVEFDNLSETVEYFKTGIHWQQLKRNFHRQSPFFSNGSPGFAGPPTFIDPTSTVTTSVVNTNDTINTIEWLNTARLALEDHKVTVGFDMGYDSNNLPETETQTVLAVAGPGIAGGGATTTVDRIRAKADQFRFGWFAQDQLDVDQFTFTPGLRLDYFTVSDDESDFNDNRLGVSGSVGTVAHVSDTHSVFLNLATGYRAPDLGERFQNGIVNIGVPSRLIGKADLSPERAYTTELGTKLEKKNYTLKASTFYSRVNHYIGRVALGVVDGFDTEQYTNVGKVDLYGGEVEGRVKLIEPVSLFANIGRTYTKDSDKVNVPSWVFNYGVEYAQDICECTYMKRFTADLVARSVMHSRDDTASAASSGISKYPGYTTLNLEMNLAMAETKLGKGSIIGGVRNIFDKTYREPFFSDVQPGVNGYIGVQFEF